MQPVGLHRLVVDEACMADLAAQHEARLGGHPATDLVDQVAHVRCRGARTGLDEVGMLLADERPAGAQAAQPAAIDQLTGA